MKSLQEYLEESLLQHIALELKDLDPIYEKYGEYDGLKELANYIEKRLVDDKQSFKIQYDEVSNIENIVFDELEIEFKNEGEYAAYKVEETKQISNITKHFEYIKIEIYYSLTEKHHKNSLNSIIEHELVHLFNDYKIQCLGFKTFLDLFNTTLYKQSKNFNTHNKPLEVRELRRALYLFNEYEKNAFIAQLCNEIREIKKTYSPKNYIDATKMYDMITNLDIYKSYMNIGIFINRFYNNDLTKKEKENIVKEWNELYENKNNLTIEQIFKKLKQSFIKTKNKIESIIPKKIAEELDYYSCYMDGECISNLFLT